MLAAIGMAVHVGQALLNDTVQSVFDIRGKTGGVAQRRKDDIHAAPLLKSSDIPPDRGCETELVENRRVEQIGERAQLLEGLYDQFLRAGDGGNGVGGHRSRRSRPSCRSAATRILCRRVVEFAGNLSPCIVLRLQEQARKPMMIDLGSLQIIDIGGGAEPRWRTARDIGQQAVP